MNIDDSKLTAFALNQLSEPEHSEMARAVAESEEAHRAVEEIRQLAGALRNEFASEVQGDLGIQPRWSVMDIQDDPWFWSRARPLAIAAMVALGGLIAAIWSGTYQRRHDSAHQTNLPNIEYAEIESEDGGRAIANPFRTDLIAGSERVVVGELPAAAGQEKREVRIIEVITDPFRLDRLKKRLTSATVMRMSDLRSAGGNYELLFLDRNGKVVAAASFHYAPGTGFVLHPSRRAGVEAGHFFIGGDADMLPGNWKPGIDYSSCFIAFPDWNECVGYSPGV